MFLGTEARNLSIKPTLPQASWAGKKRAGLPRLSSRLERHFAANHDLKDLILHGRLEISTRHKIAQA